MLTRSMLRRVLMEIDDLAADRLGVDLWGFNKSVDEIDVGGQSGRVAKGAYSVELVGVGPPLVE